MRRRPTFGPLHPRLVATLALIPLTFGLDQLTRFAVEIYFHTAARPRPLLSHVLFYLMSIVPAVVPYAGALLIWWRAVEWTPRRRWAVLITSLAFLGACGLSLSLASLPGVGSSLRSGISLTACAIALAVVGWIVYDVPPAEAAGSRVPCRQCGYDLRGQRECRCPECGTEFSLGELIHPSDEVRS